MLPVQSIILKEIAILLPTLWLGVLIGISFIATPVKFRAPSLTRPAALEVGRLTFRLFSRIEWGFAILVLGAVAAAERSAWPLSLAVLAAGLVALQSTWLLPALNRRVDMVIASGTSAPSGSHLGYSVTEGLKFLALLALVAAGIGHPV